MMLDIDHILSATSELNTKWIYYLERIGNSLIILRMYVMCVVCF